MRILKLSFGFLVILLSTGCISGLSQVNRRPYMDQMNFVAINNKGFATAKSQGEGSFEHCTKRINFGLFTTGEDPKMEDLKAKIRDEEGVKYMSNARSVEYGDSGIIWGSSCIRLEGEVFK